MSRYGLGTIKITEEDANKLNEDCGRPLNRIKSGEYIVDYGFDHALGYFLMGFDIQEPEEVAFDFDSIFHGLTGSSLGCFLKKYKAPKEHIDMCFLDRDF